MKVFNVFVKSKFLIIYGGSYTKEETAKEICEKFNALNDGREYFYKEYTLDTNMLESDITNINNLKLLKVYYEKYGIECTNDMGEHRTSSINSIAFPNGYVASIVYKEDKKKYSVAVCDWNGYFDWDILKKYCGNGSFLCDTEDEIISACEVIRNL